MALCAFASAALIGTAPAALHAQSDCGSLNTARECRAITITIESDVDFGRVVILREGSGEVALDLETGERRVLGDVDDLGGMTITGKAVVRGAPFQHFRVLLPTSIAMRDRRGSRAKVNDFVTDLPALPRLDGNGQLVFRFTGTLVLDEKTKGTGRMRGRVPISVEYQ